MAKIALTGTPTDLIATGGLDAGTTYAMKAELPAAGGHADQYRPPGPFVRISDEGATAPTDLQAGWPLGHLDEALMVSGTDDTLWAWVSQGTAIIQVHESVL